MAKQCAQHSEERRLFALRLQPFAIQSYTVYCHENLHSFQLNVQMAFFHVLYGDNTVSDGYQCLDVRSSRLIHKFGKGT